MFQIVLKVGAKKSLNLAQTLLLLEKSQFTCSLLMFQITLKLIGSISPALLVLFVGSALVPRLNWKVSLSDYYV